MIKGTGAAADGTPLLVLGLTGENMARLMADEPIVVAADRVDPRLPAMTVLLVGGRDNQAIVDQLQQLPRLMDRSGRQEQL